MTGPPQLVDSRGQTISRPEPRLRRFGRKSKAAVIGIAALIAAVAALLSNVTAIREFVSPERSPVTTSTAGSPLLTPNAFKAGYALSKLVDAPAAESHIWKNRLAAHLSGLALNESMLTPFMSDGALSNSEGVILRDQIRATLDAKYGRRAAATFVIGADLEPSTLAFERYLTSREFREQLAASNVSIMEFGFSVNANIDEADFPDELKKAWVSIYVKTYAGHADPGQLENIRRFRERILEHFL